MSTKNEIAREALRLVVERDLSAKLWLERHYDAVVLSLYRLPGWIAQWWEQNQAPTSRIARPRQIYTGRTEAHYIPMEQRD